MLTLFHKVGVIHEVFSEAYLLVGLFVHEVVALAVLVEELVRPSLDVDDFDLGTGGEGILEYASVLEVTEFGLYECRALAWLNVLEPYDGNRLAVEVHEKAVLEISCCCHKYR